MAQATLLLDPTHEEACRIVMRCAAEAGETGAAIRAYDELYRLLDEDYDMEPSAATQELIAEVKQGKYDWPAGRITGGARAVLRGRNEAGAGGAASGRRRWWNRRRCR